MKSPIMLVCVMVAAMGGTLIAADAVAPAACPAAVKGEKGKHGPMTEAQREAFITKRLEKIKATDEAKYNELIALKASDPVAFKAKMHEMGKAHHAKGKANAVPAK